MIIDGYPSSFAQWDSACGYESLAQKMRVIQSELGGHHQPTMRVRDRKHVDNTSLADPDTGELTGAAWTRHNGQIAWTYKGETYKKQYFPPMLHNLECPPELMMAEMDYAGRAHDSGVCPARRRRPPHVGFGLAHGGPVLHVPAERGPVWSPLRVPQ
jgi:hypothetical protein